MTLALTDAAPSAVKQPPYSGSYKLPGAATPAAGPIDYGKLLAGDYGLTQSNANLDAQGVSNLAGLQTGVRGQLVRYGDIPTGLTGDLAGYVDPTTKQLASQNTAAGNSTVAQLRKAYDTQTQGDTASLAARGLLRSGAYGQHANEDLSNYNQAGYQASQQLLDYLSGLYSGYQTQQASLGQQRLQAQNDALNRIIAQINAGTLGGGSTPPPPPSTPPPGGNGGGDGGSGGDGGGSAGGTGLSATPYTVPIGNFTQPTITPADIRAAQMTSGPLLTSAQLRQPVKPLPKALSGYAQGSGANLR